MDQPTPTALLAAVTEVVREVTSAGGALASAERVTWDSSWSKEETANRLGGAILRTGDSGPFLLVWNDPGRISGVGEPKLVVSAPTDVSKNQHKTASHLDTAIGAASPPLVGVSGWNLGGVEVSISPAAQSGPLAHLSL